MIQAISLCGALLILAAFGLQQWRRLRADDWVYLWANCVGAGVLTVVAWLEAQWGFLVLEGAWTAISAQSLISKARGK